VPKVTSGRSAPEVRETGIGSIQFVNRQQIEDTTAVVVDNCENQGVRTNRATARPRDRGETHIAEQEQRRQLRASALPAPLKPARQCR